LKSKYINQTWIAFCSIIIVISVVSSILVYLHVANELSAQAEQRLAWEAKFYREQLDQIFLRMAVRADNLVRSAAIQPQNRTLLQNELRLMRNSFPSLSNGWIAYPNGILILAPNTSSHHVLHLPWWQQYLDGRFPKAFLGYPLGRSQAMVGKPFTDQPGMTTIVPLVSLNFSSSQPTCAIGLELDINQALTDNTGVDIDWSTEPVSIYTEDGRLIASPFRYFQGNSESLMQKSHAPLIRLMRQHPNEPSGFAFYTENHHKMVGTFLRDPSLGMVIVVSRLAAEVVDPVRQIAFGPLIVAALCLFIAALFSETLISGFRRLREAERLTSQAEFQALQAHINPHFLFNVLNQMVSFATLAGNNSLTMMLRSLTHIFHYAIRKPGTIVSLKEELDYLQEYINLQQLRYGTQFTYQVSVPDVLLAISVLKFCIQPLVENCFIHGLEKSLDPIAIKVTITSDAATITVEVSDDGPGITEQRLQEVNQQLIMESFMMTGQGQSIGLTNIHHRIRYTYGPKYGISLTSLTPGLSVCLRMPRN
jgi:signal transduction histidine kinase